MYVCMLLDRYRDTRSDNLRELAHPSRNLVLASAVLVNGYSRVWSVDRLTSSNVSKLKETRLVSMQQTTRNKDALSLRPSTDTALRNLREKSTQNATLYRPSG
jgi:hypothetical protein